MRYIYLFATILLFQSCRKDDTVKPIDFGEYITGRVEEFYTKKPIKNSKVFFSVSENNIFYVNYFTVYESESDSNGYFKIKRKKLLASDDYLNLNTNSTFGVAASDPDINDNFQYNSHKVYINGITAMYFTITLYPLCEIRYIINDVPPANLEITEIQIGRLENDSSIYWYYPQIWPLDYNQSTGYIRPWNGYTDYDAYLKLHTGNDTILDNDSILHHSFFAIGHTTLDIQVDF